MQEDNFQFLKPSFIAKLSSMISNPTKQDQTAKQKAKTPKHRRFHFENPKSGQVTRRNHYQVIPTLSFHYSLIFIKFITTYCFFVST